MGIVTSVVCGQQWFREAYAQVVSQTPQFATRAMVRDVLSPLEKSLEPMNSAIRKFIYHKLTGNQVIMDHGTQDKAMWHRIQAFHEADDPEVFFDMRKLNGRTESQHFLRFIDAFGTECLDTALCVITYSNVRHRWLYM